MLNGSWRDSWGPIHYVIPKVYFESLQVIKSIFYHFHFERHMFWATPHVLWFSTLNYFKLGTWQQTPQYTSSWQSTNRLLWLSWYMFVESVWNEYIELWVSTMILYWRSSTFETYNLFWYLNTSSSATKDDWDWFITTFTSSPKSIKWTLTYANLWTFRC